MLFDTYYHNKLLTQQQLSVMCKICCFFYHRNNVSAQWACTVSVSVSPISDFWRLSYYSVWLQILHLCWIYKNFAIFSLMKWETPTFISLDLWLPHPDLNPMNHKICIEIHQRVCLRKIHNVNGQTMVWLAWLWAVHHQ